MYDEASAEGTRGSVELRGLRWESSSRGASNDKTAAEGEESKGKSARDRWVENRA